MYTYTKLNDTTQTVYANLEGIACMIEESDFDAFIKKFKSNISIYKSYFNHIKGLKASQDGRTYTSIKDIVWMNWKEERDSTMEIGNYEIHFLVSSATEDSTSRGEEYYNLPSKIIREGTGIIDTDKMGYYNEKDKLIAFSVTNQTSSYKANSQELLFIDGVHLKNFCKENGLKVFWIFWDFRRTTLEIESKDGFGYHLQNSRMWLVWDDASEIQKIEFINSRFTN